jgi:hypothetical protein
MYIFIFTKPMSKKLLEYGFFVLPTFGISKLTFLAIFCGMLFEFTLKTPKKFPSFYWLHG